MVINTVDKIVRRDWDQDLEWICPCGEVISQSVRALTGEWTLKPAKKICCSDNGFSSGIVEIGDCVWARDSTNRDTIFQITHVCFLDLEYFFWLF